MNQPSPSSKSAIPRTGPKAAHWGSDFNADIGQRLRALIQRQGRTLQDLAAISGLSEKTLNGLTAGKITPTINLLWKLANALGVPVGSFISARYRPGMYVLRQADRKVITSNDKQFTSRILFPYDAKRLVEFYELTIAPRHAVNSEAHVPGTLESLIVVRGQIALTVGKEPKQNLREGDAMVFEGDVPHKYHNRGSSEALLYLVMSYLNDIEG